MGFFIFGKFEKLFFLNKLNLTGKTALSALTSMEQNFDVTKINTKIIDVSNQRKVRGVVDELWGDDFCIDILVNNAAIDHKVKGKQGVLETSRIENSPIYK